MFMKSPFDKYAKEYDLSFDKYKNTFYSELHAVRELIPHRGVGIEIGAGTGWFASHLGIKIGLEPSENMANIAKSRGIEIIKAFAENIPVPDEEYDYAVMITTICFLKKPETSLKEIFRILKPQGSIIIGFIEKNSALGIHYQNTQKSRTFLKNAKFYSVKEINKMLSDAGFSGFEYRQTLFNPTDQISQPEQALDGTDKGSFIVIKGIREVSVS